MTDWPELDPHDTVLYQNDSGRPNRLVLHRLGDGYSLRIDSILGDKRQAPPLSREDLIDIAAQIAVETRVTVEEILLRVHFYKKEEG